MSVNESHSPIVCITQARMTSSRLPGKVLMEIEGKPLLYYHLSRLKRAKLIDKIVVATTVNETDDPIVNYCESVGVKTFRGDEHNVLSRYAECAKKFNAKTIVRVTSDCPLIDPLLVDETIEYFQKHHPSFEYVELDPDIYPSGFDVEVFSYDALVRTIDEAHTADHREHVTSYIYEHPDIFSVNRYANGSFDYKPIHLSVDTEDDFNRASNIIQYFSTKNTTEYSWTDCVKQAHKQ